MIFIPDFLPVAWRQTNTRGTRPKQGVDHAHLSTVRGNPSSPAWWRGVAALDNGYPTLASPFNEGCCGDRTDRLSRSAGWPGKPSCFDEQATSRNVKDAGLIGSAYGPGTCHFVVASSGVSAQ